MRTKWNGFTLDAFSSVFCSVFCSVYSLHSYLIDDLLKELSHSSAGCYWENIFVGALAYADDLTLLAPSPSVLGKLLVICEKSGSVLRLPDKTQCIRFSRERPGVLWQVYQLC